MLGGVASERAVRNAVNFAARVKEDNLLAPLDAGGEEVLEGDGRVGVRVEGRDVVEGEEVGRAVDAVAQQHADWRRRDCG